MNTIVCSKSKELNEFSPHDHPDLWEVSILVSGSAKIVMNDICYDTNKNDVRILPPGTFHSAIKGPSFSDIYFHSKNLDFSDIIIVHDYDGNIRRLIEMLDKVMTEKEENYSAIADSLTDTICQYIKKYSKANFKYSFVVELKNTLYHNISNADFNISNEIKKLGYNTDYFRRCFKHEFNKTPLEYLTCLRIEHAKKLLVQTIFQNIENVAFQCGFNDSYYFSKIFKSYTGLSPRSYRKKNYTPVKSGL